MFASSHYRGRGQPDPGLSVLKDTEINTLESELGRQDRDVDIFVSRVSFTASSNSTGQLSSTVSLIQGDMGSAQVPVKFPRPFYPQLRRK